MDSVALIIPAAGSGERLDRETPKPYITIAGRTILEHTLQRFAGVDEINQVIVAVSETYVDTASAILRRTVASFDCGWEWECVVGGQERQHSIYNALQRTGAVDLVAVHDAVRPFVTPEIIRECIRTASEVGGAVAGVKAKDTVKRAGENRLIRETPDRSQLWQAQTPQVFRKELLMEAYRKALDEHVVGTDDASLVERLGHEVQMVEGGRDNFKITYPIDLKLATLLLEERS